MPESHIMTWNRTYRRILLAERGLAFWLRSFILLYVILHICGLLP